VGAQLGKVSFQTCEAAAEAALGAPDPMAGRAAVRELLGH
jgi:phosphotransferase system enzyme I (PtsI)